MQIVDLEDHALGATLLKEHGPKIIQDSEFSSPASDGRVRNVFVVILLGVLAASIALIEPLVNSAVLMFGRTREGALSFPRFANPPVE